MSDATCTVVVDIGRLGADEVTRPIVERARRLLVVLRPVVEDVAVFAAKMPALRQHRPLIVLIGDAPYRPADVSESVGCDAVSIACDPKAVDAMWSGRGRRALPRSAFARTVAALADQLRLEASASDRVPA